MSEVQEAALSEEVLLDLVKTLNLESETIKGLGIGIFVAEDHPAAANYNCRGLPLTRKDRTLLTELSWKR